MFTARQGTHLLDFGGAGSAHAPDVPRGGCVHQRRRPGCALDLRDAVARLQREDPLHSGRRMGRARSRTRSSCCTSRAQRSPTPAVGEAIRSLLDEEFGAELPDGYGVGTLPVAGDPQPDGSDALGGGRRRARPADRARTARSRSGSSSVTSPSSAAWSATDTGSPGSPSRTSAPGRRHSWRRTSWSWPRTRSAPRSCSGPPASGRTALGHYLTEHPVVISTVALDAERMGRYATEEDLKAELARRARTRQTPSRRSTASRSRSRTTPSPSR